MQFHSVRGAFAAQRPSRSKSTKASAATLLHIRGSASHCPFAFSRVLDRILVLGGVPHSISFQHCARSIRFSLAVDGLSQADPLLVADRLRAIPTVRAVRVTRHPRAR